MSCINADIEFDCGKESSVAMTCRKEDVNVPKATENVQLHGLKGGEKASGSGVSKTPRIGRLIQHSDR